MIAMSGLADIGALAEVLRETRDVSGSPGAATT
jgi:hypothetical protein